MRSSLLAALLLCLAPLAEAGKIHVLTSIPNHAALALAIGQGEVEVESIVKGNRDVHSVELLPSFMVKAGRAEVYVTVGMDLDTWAQQIIDGSRNASLLVVDASQGITRLQVPTSKVDSSQGDVHAHGNPHYWLDPANVRAQGEVIRDALARVRPDLAEALRANLEAHVAAVDAAMKTWQARMAPYAGVQVVSFHDSWPYFAARFGLKVVAFLEPTPGVPPPPTHIAALTQLLRGGQVKAIVMESYFDDRVPLMLSRSTGVPVVKVPVLLGAVPGTEDDVALFDTITRSLARALGGHE